MPRIGADAVLDLARAQQQDWIDAAAAARIAVGASAVVAAVDASLRDLEPGLLTDDATEFLALLERLADPAA